MSAPLREDLSYLGRKRKCVVCKRSTPMYWIPDDWWRTLTGGLRGHVCFGCILLMAELIVGVDAPDGRDGPLAF